MDFHFPTLREALVLLPFVIPICVWVAWSDMKFMKIPNKAVLAMAAVWLVVGWLAVPLTAWLWGFALMAGVLVAGFVLNAAGLFGAGDAKFAAAMAPVFVGGDLRLILALYAACSLAAFAAHRAMKHLPAFRRAAPDWLSWTSPKFPMGLALTGMLLFYLLTAFLPQG
ncbi:prepilin peptidase [Xinfangfangia pollutisoli]|uniref:prepilin peptidase n=1 Tax=Xinfangfangia pollutisoli TaxID=2865960 RepID=UPI001CD434FA|nr:prepilin peptidase [Xinfangfangia pollutisoli]